MFLSEEPASEVGPNHVESTIIDAFSSMGEILRIDAIGMGDGPPLPILIDDYPEELIEKLHSWWDAQAEDTWIETANLRFAEEAVAYGLELTRAIELALAERYGTPGADSLTAYRETFDRLHRGLETLSGGKLTTNAAVAERAARAAREAASDVGAQRLANDFDAIAERERWRSYAFQSLAVAFFVAGVAASVWLFSRGDDISSLDVGEVLARGSLSIPGLVLFGYLTREAGGHRRQATWAGQIAVQLSTVRAYVSDLDDESANKILTKLGLAVFSGAASSGEWSALRSGRSKGSSESELSELVSQLERLLASARSN